MSADDLVRRFHARMPGAATRVFGASGEGYRRLADAVSAGPVLDLGCGDGALVELVAARGFDVVGADMSPEEIDAARRRLDGRAAFHIADARALPSADGAFATVVSHMAFMLMQPTEDVVREIARVLRPGGRFVAVVGRDAAPCQAERLFFSKLNELLGKERVPSMNLVDDRTTEAASLARLFPSPTWRDFAHEDFGHDVRVAASDLGPWFEQAFYAVEVLSPAGRSELLAWIDAERARLAPDGSMTWTFPARQFVVVRR